MIFFFSIQFKKEEITKINFIKLLITDMILQFNKQRLWQNQMCIYSQKRIILFENIEFHFKVEENQVCDKLQRGGGRVPLISTILIK